MTVDRRAHPRFPLILAVQYVGAEVVLDYTENLSAGGLFIRTDREFALGERVTLVLSFPQLLEPVELQVEVVRTRAATDDAPAGVAVEVPEELAAERAKLREVAATVAGTRGPAPAFRVLLVEDNALVASMYTAALRRLAETEHLPAAGIELASDGRAAFERLLREPRIDILVTDVFMPVLSGISLVEKIRAEPTLASLPVVVVTGGGDQERERLQELGITAFLRKPVSYGELAGALRSHMEARGPSASRPKDGRATGSSGGGEAAPSLTDGDGVSTNHTSSKPASRR